MNKWWSNVPCAARWFAVVAVVLYHVRFLLFAGYDRVHDKNLLLKLFYFVTGLGHEGFVLYMVTGGMLLGGLSLQRWPRQGPRAWRDAARKVAWLYAFLVPAVLLGGVLDLAGSRIFSGTGVYAYFDLFRADFSVKTVAENLLPVQRFVVPGLGSNAMLYLLAYECWAYLAFAAYVLPARRWLGMVASLAIAVGGSVLAPEFLGYLLLWLMGAVAWHRRERFRLRLGISAASVLFVASLVASCLLSPRDNEFAPHVVLILQTLLDLQFGVAAVVLLLVLARRPNAGGARLLWRLNRHVPSGSSVVLASHFPFMMFAVAAASRVLALPIAGQPRAVLFVLLAVQVVAIFLYGWGLALVARWLVRRWPRTRPVALAHAAGRAPARSG